MTEKDMLRAYRQASGGVERIAPSQVILSPTARAWFRRRLTLDRTKNQRASCYELPGYAYPLLKYRQAKGEK